MPYVLIGLVAGFFSALFGVGGGVVIVPLLVLIVRWQLRNATATSLAAIAVTATAGVLVYVVQDEVRPLYALLVGVPAAFGSFAGSTLQQRVPLRVLSYLFAALLAGIGVDLLLR